MFLDRKLRRIQEEKGRLALCCELRRRLCVLNVREFLGGLRNGCRLLDRGVALAEFAFGLLREFRTERRRN
ncbi:hypothetical protein dsx2_3194 [Desulfovibrio sp. X2]|uniref:hypothetical protein n=1 Tax=Desulfovibrio sp. X2 TaxID=941449 RepID=UPI000358791E|nr:hypothetical protein [Desulfovibrio sp. X2]EPR41441.1 hypothetical protein dsx2_3194 [Desulfovibrio sp. X2]